MKETDIRSLEGIDHMRSVLQEWMKPYLTSENVIKEECSYSRTCPCCGGKSNSTMKIVNGFLLVECDSCGTIFANPTFNEETLSHYYNDPKSRGSYDEDVLKSGTKPTARLDSIFMPRLEKILNYVQSKKIDQHSKILDVGCASGQFLSVVKSKTSFELNGIEASSVLADTAKELLPEAVIHNITIEKSNLQESTFDVLTCWEVLEHLNEPLPVLQKAYSLLKKGGYFFLPLPNMDGFDSRVMWMAEYPFTPPAHLNFFKYSSIEKLFQRAGFEVVEKTTPGILDVNIIKNRLDWSPEIGKRLGSFLESHFRSESKQSESFLQNLQQNLKENNLSGHMMIVCKKS